MATTCATRAPGILCAGPAGPRVRIAPTGGTPARVACAHRSDGRGSLKDRLDALEKGRSPIASGVNLNAGAGAFLRERETPFGITTEITPATVDPGVDPFW